MAPTSERVSEIQTALAGQGAYQGDPSGKWDDSTVDAMKKYQSSQGLTPNGKLDARTLEKLGLGSSTAGRAAPMPTATPSPNLLISRSQVPQQAPQDDK
jgi:peptidoglycan hydrolase-like protein with peptidoglycan-binding domain